MSGNGIVGGPEFRERQRRATEAAAERGLDALVVWSRGGTSVDFYGDVFYLANHHSPFPPNQDTPQWSARSYSGLVLPAEGDPVLVVDLPEFDPDQLHVDDIRSTLHVPQGVAQVLRERGLDGARLGLSGRDTLLLSHLLHMQGELGHELHFEPADDILERMRMVKSPAELELIRRAAEVGVGWVRTMMEAVEPGRTEGEVIGDGLRYLAANGGFPYDAAIASGSRSQYFFSRFGIPTWDAQWKIERGDLVHIDAWAAIDGYYTDFVRSTVAGRQPTDEQRELLEGAVTMIDHIIEAVRPGVTIGELYARGSAWMVDNGFGEHRARLDSSGTDFGNLFPAFGHSFGAGLEPPWIIDGEPTIVEENMCLAIEALLGRPGVGGAGFEHNVIVGADGCEVITASCPSRWWE
jgi:Xaa-Pro aminopeptidase